MLTATSLTIVNLEDGTGTRLIKLGSRPAPVILQPPFPFYLGGGKYWYLRRIDEFDHSDQNRTIAIRGAGTLDPSSTARSQDIRALVKLDLRALKRDGKITLLP